MDGADDVVEVVGEDVGLVEGEQVGHGVEFEAEEDVDAVAVDVALAEDFGAVGGEVGEGHGVGGGEGDRGVAGDADLR
ncbi:MAG: hypothetical protein U0841_01070 [Chloroflexia bacterium]